MIVLTTHIFGGSTHTEEHETRIAAVRSAKRMQNLTAREAEELLKWHHFDSPGARFTLDGDEVAS